MKRSAPDFCLHLSLALLSVAIIAFQLVLMRILSITQWYHFAAMIISVALLGFGASGTLISLAREKLLAKIELLLPLLVFASAATMAASVALGQALVGGFDSYLLFFEAEQAWRLLLVNLLFGLPFFLGALAIGLVFVRHVERIGTLYFANLIGSGFGGITALILLGLATPERLPALAALFALAAGLLLCRGRGGPTLLAACASALVIALFLINPPPLALSEYKDLRGALNLPGTEIVIERTGPYALTQILSGPALRHAPGLSLKYDRPLPRRDAAYSNGDWFGAIPLPPEPGEELPIDFTTSALPYALSSPRQVLILHSGTGEEVARALSRGAEKVVAVEPHRAVLDLLERRYPGTFAGFPEEKLALHPVEPRTWLATDRSRYDLIVPPAVGAFGGSVGLAALAEEHIYTREAFSAMWNRLGPKGLICVTAWIDYPARAPLRLAASLIEMLEEAGVGSPQAHLAAVRSWGTVTFCVKRSPLTAAEVERVRLFCRRLLFDPLLLPDLEPDERQRHNLLQDPRFLEDLDRLFTPEREDLYENYPFRLRPVTDDRPFFSQFLRWRSLSELARLLGERTLPFLEMGYMIVVLTFFQAAVAALALIILPLFRIGWRGGKKFGTFAYFGGLGIGFMLTEIVLIHRFVFYLGTPIYSAAAVITAVLVFSGAGSWSSARFENSDAAPKIAAGTVALLLVAYSLLLPPLLTATIGLELAWKFLLALLLLAPLSFAMGFPFPLGLGLLARRKEAEVPWAWGINGCLSVVSSAMATIIAVEVGFAAVLVTASAAYAAASLFGLRT